LFVGEQGGTEIARTDENDFPYIRDAEYFLEIREQLLNIVSLASDAELAGIS
jgi:hypothetical protein